MNPCPKCGETEWLGLLQYAAQTSFSTFQVHCFCGFKGPECGSQKLAEEAWNLDPIGKFTQLSLLA